MKPWQRWIWTLAVLAQLLPTSSARAQADYTAELAQIDATDYPTLTLYVSVHDGAGQIVEGLVQDQFRITEDDVPVEIVDFSAGNRAAISAVLTVDRSGSMNEAGKLAGAKTSAATFVELMRPQDQVALAVFADTVEVLQPFTTERTTLLQQIQSITADGCTAWYDGIYQSIDLIQPLTGRRSVILLSDGVDCREDMARWLMGYGSTHTLDEAIEHARAVDVPVYTIGFGAKAASAEADGFDPLLLQRVADETGGKYYHAPDAETLKRLYQSLSVEMQKEYVITYRSPRPTYDGTNRDIVVAIEHAGVGSALVTRGGYLEQHLLNIHSEPRIFLAFLLPLLVLLGLPTALAKTAHPARRQSTAPPVPTSPAPTAGSPSPPIAAMTAMPAASLIASYPVPFTGADIGRAFTNHIVINHPSVAPQHAHIAGDDKRFVLHDLSGGQTLVSFQGEGGEERPATQNALKDGSTVRLGQVRGTIRMTTPGAGCHFEIPFALHQPVTAIGRAGEHAIVVNDPASAAHQAEIRWERDRFVIDNLAAVGNVAVSYSGDPAQARPVTGRNALKSGSVVWVGNVMFKLVVQER